MHVKNGTGDTRDGCNDPQVHFFSRGGSIGQLFNLYCIGCDRLSWLIECLAPLVENAK